MPNLTTTYMGLKLRSPLVVSANPLSQKLENILAMEDAGAGAVVLFSLFEEQIRQVAATTEARGVLSGPVDYAIGSGKYLEIIRKAKERVNIPIIASLNGVTPEGWTDYARDIEQAGADGLEINVYFIPADITLTSAEVEKRYTDIVRMIRSSIKIPIAVKMNPYFSSIGNMSQQLQSAGADALVLFNRFYQPDFDINDLVVLPNLELSTPAEIRLPLLWIAVLYGRVPVSLAATTGIHGARELVKYLLAGADVGMCASVLFQRGIPRIKEILDDLKLYMSDMPFESIDAFKGSMSQQHISDPTDYERSNYLQILENKQSGRQATGRL
ncbi:MAG: dihydroorotate dehydrogenase-like protein [Pyrinomonadaceae bacterium]